MTPKTSRKGNAGVKKRALIITAVVFVVLLIPAATLALFSYSQAKIVNVRVTADRETLAGLAGTALSAKLTKLAGVISSLTSSKQLIADVAAGHFNDGIAITRSFESNPTFSDSYIGQTVLLNASGTEVALYPAPEIVEGGVPKMPVTWDVSPWYRAFASGASVYVSGVTVADQSSSLSTDIVIVVPIISSSTGGANGIIGFGLVKIPTDNFLNFDRNISIGKFGYVYLVDQDSNIIADPETPSGAADIISDASDSAADLALAGQSGTEIDYDAIANETSFVAYAPVPDYHWGVIITEPYQETFSASESILFTMEFGLGLFALIAAAVLVLLFYFLNRRQP